MKPSWILVLIIVAGISGYLLSNASNTGHSENSLKLENSNAPAGSDERFNFLAAQTSNNCGLQRQTVFGYLDDQRIQGSCCNKMDHHSYMEQIEGLKKYKDISIIPPDPYDVSASQAKQLFKFFEEVKLNENQQSVYNKAMNLSMEGGPCCCKCWHWDAYEGLAKKLIVSYNWNSEQIAKLWDLSDACGGAGHEHG